MLCLARTGEHCSMSRAPPRQLKNSKQTQLSPLPRALKRPPPRLGELTEPEAPHGRVEHAFERANVFTFTPLAGEEARIVELAAAHLAGAREYFFCGERQVLAEP